MKVDKPIRVQLTINQESRAIAFIVTLLAPLGDYAQLRVLKAVGAYLNYKVERI